MAVMNIRDWLNRNSVLVGIVAVIAMIVSIIFLIRGSIGIKEKIEGVYYYDENTNQLFVGEGGLLAPIDAPSGPNEDGEPAGVLAYVFGCAQCDRDMRGETAEELAKKGIYIVYLESYLPEVKAQLDQFKVEGQEQYFAPAGKMTPGKLVRTLEGDWVNANSQLSGDVFSSFAGLCLPGKRLKACLPGQR